MVSCTAFFTVPLPQIYTLITTGTTPILMLFVQVTLYAMMCSERRRDIEAGILLYLKELSMQLVPANYSNKRGLYIKYATTRCAVQ